MWMRTSTRAWPTIAMLITRVLERSTSRATSRPVSSGIGRGGAQPRGRAPLREPAEALATRRRAATLACPVPATDEEISLYEEFRSEATAYADVPDQQSLEHEEPDAVRKTVRPVAGPGATRNPHDSRDAFLDHLSANRSGNRLSQIHVLTKHVADRSRAKSPGGHASTAMCAAAGSHAG